MVRKFIQPHYYQKKMSNPSALHSSATTDVVNVKYVSTTNIQPAVATHKDPTQQMQQLHLTPWDLVLLPMQYVQKGLLFMKPKEDLEKILHHLKTTLSQALAHFYPIAGRLGTTFHDEDNTTSFYIDCNSKGVEFIHATADEISLSDCLNPVYVPFIIQSFFPRVLKSYHGRTQPLLTVQVTELIDGIFIGFSVNHLFCDASSCWFFLNSWSQISRNSLEDPKSYVNEISRSPIFKPWFLNESDLPIHIPFINDYVFTDDAHAFTEKLDIKQVPPLLERRFFHFSSENIAKLKSKANNNFESGTTLNGRPISSLLALLTHVWIAVTRARRFDSNQVINFLMPIETRKRLIPSLPDEYVGNGVTLGIADVKAGELLEKGLGFGASLLIKLVETHNDEFLRSSYKTWVEKPVFSQLTSGFDDMFLSTSVAIGDSPKSDMYGNDFGWGKPIAIRSGCANKYQGLLDLHPGIVQGSIDIEVSLPLETMEALGGDAEFMEFVTILPPFKKQQQGNLLKQQLIPSCI